MNNWYYYPEIRLNVEDKRRLIYWNNQNDWEFACKKLSAIIPVFSNKKQNHRLEFIHRKPFFCCNNAIIWYGLGGILGYNGEFTADFAKVPQRVHPLGRHDEIDDEAVFWGLTETTGIYQRMYESIGG